MTTPNVTIDWNAIHQNIDGYGAAIPYIASQFVNFPQKSKVMDLLFDPNLGIGLSILRNWMRLRSGCNSRRRRGA